MPPWGSKWLESETSLESHQDGAVADLRTQPAGISDRPHGTRWFKVVQGIRRSLDVHLKSYYKIDSAFASTLRFTSASDKLSALSRGLTDTGLIDFCCVYLVHPTRGTFGIVALSGAGSELFPPQLSEEAARRTAGSCDSGASSFLNVFTRCVFQVKDSNWSVEDVVTSKAPWYYDCASAANGFGLPQDGGWLRRVGMRSVLALPCMHGNDVTGVLAVASKQKSLDHLLLRKLEELCNKVTPIVTDAVVEHSRLLCNRRVAARYESINDFAHEVLGELLNLDGAVAFSVSLAEKETAASQHREQQLQLQLPQPAAVMAALTNAGSCGSRGRRFDDGSSRFDPAVAMAAAAAAGFSWTTPAVAVAAAPVQQQQQQTAKQAAPDRDSPSFDTFCTALTSAATERSSAALADLPSAQMPSGLLAPLPSAAAVATAAAAESIAATSPAGPMHLCQSLPQRCNAAGAPVIGFLRTGAQAQLQRHRRSQGPSSGDRNMSRSTRSLSCLEFSGGAVDARDALISGSDSAANVVAALAPSTDAVTTSSGHPFRRLAAPQVPHSMASSALFAPAAAAVTLVSSNRTTESDKGYMIESSSTEDLMLARSGFMVSLSVYTSSHNADSRAMHRGTPLEPSVGCAQAAGHRTASSGCTRIVPTAAAAARGSTCATASATVADTTTIINTFGYTFTNTGTNTAAGSNTTHLSSLMAATEAWANDNGCGRGHDGVDDLVDMQTARHDGASAGRWSRDSAAAAAAVWSNEVADAFAAAMRFTAAQAKVPCVGGNAWVDRNGGAATSTLAVGRAAHSDGENRCYPAGAFGGLYGIRESGPVSSLPLSLDMSCGSGSDDGGVVVDLASGGGFIISSGLGAEAHQRHQQHSSQSLMEGDFLSSDKMAGEQQWPRYADVRS